MLWHQALYYLIGKRMIKMNDPKPSIKIYIYSNRSLSNGLNNILWGIEEEGLLYEINIFHMESAINLAYKAALDSRLDVGIGVGEDGEVVLHYAKLNEESPLFICNLQRGNVVLRTIGANAARLVKGIPFKLVGDIG